MRYNIYLYKKEGQAAVSEYIGSIQDADEAMTVSATLARVLGKLETYVLEVRVVDEDFNCVYSKEVKEGRKNDDAPAT